jgi:hypothetical protein
MYLIMFFLFCFSPVASMLPVVTLFQNETVSFIVPASDNEGQTLKYPLSSIMSSTWTQQISFPIHVFTHSSSHIQQLSLKIYNSILTRDSLTLDRD